MMHGARLEFSKLRLQEPAPPVIPAPQATQPLPAPGAASLQNTMNSVKLPLLQVRLASLASLPAPTAAAAAATSLQDTTDIECPVLVAALPGEAGFAGQTHRTWAPFKPTGMLPDQTIVTGIVFATEVLQPPTPTPPSNCTATSWPALTCVMCCFDRQETHHAGPPGAFMLLQQSLGQQTWLVLAYLTNLKYCELCWHVL